MIVFMLRPILLALVAFFALVAHGQARADAVEGRCAYTEQVRQHSADTTLILCDSAVIEGNAIAFTQRDWGAMARFTGTLKGETMTVTGLTLRTGGWQAASGTCRSFRRGDGSLDAIRCLAKAGTRWIAANFVRSRI